MQIKIHSLGLTAMQIRLAAQRWKMAAASAQRFKFGLAGGLAEVRRRAESLTANQTRLMSVILKPGIRASVHGVRAPLPSLVAEEPEDGLEKAGEEREEKENATERPECKGDQISSEMSAAAGIGVQDKTALRHTEIARPPPIFQPSRRFRSVYRQDDRAGA